MKNINYYLLIALLGFVVSACSNDDIDFDKKKFDAQREKWDKAAIENYSFLIDYFSGVNGPQEAIITVEHGENKSIETTFGNEFERFTSIADIYNDIEKAYTLHSENLKNKEIQGFTIKIEYNNTYHYPEKVEYYVTHHESILGGYYYDYTIKEFSVLEK